VDSFKTHSHPAISKALEGAPLVDGAGDGASDTEDGSPDGAADGTDDSDGFAVGFDEGGSVDDAMVGDDVPHT
jgi:hypothetical protein